MKYNLIYFDANQLEDYFFNEDYKEAYKKFLRNKVKSMFDDPTQTCFIWTGHRTSKNYLKKDCFICMDCEGHTLPIQVERINKIWIRGKNFDYEKYKDFNVINTKVVEEIADDKNKTYEYLKDLMPKSSIVWYDGDILSTEEFDYKDFPIIIKPLNELKGNGIVKFDTEDNFEAWFLENEPSKEFILQEFIKCVDYAPLDIKGTHDIRLIIVNSEIVGLAVRQPKKDGWLCNVAQGGSIKVYDVHELYKLSKKETNYFFEDLNEFKVQVISKLPKDFKQAIFSIDFCNTKDGFKIFELNSYPGIRLEYKTYINKVKKLLNDN